MNPKRKRIAVMLGIIGLISVVLDAGGYIPNSKYYFDIVQFVCFACFVVFCLEKKISN
jgi:hypothetical protein